MTGKRILKALGTLLLFLLWLAAVNYASHMR